MPTPNSRRAAGSQSSSRSRQRCELVGLADGVGGLGQCRHAAQEAAVRLVRVGHGAETLPPVAPQLIQAAVVAGPGVRVRGDGPVVVEGLLGQRRPCHRGRRMRGRDSSRVLTRVQRLGSASLSPGSSTGSGPRRSPIRRHGLHCAVRIRVGRPRGMAQRGWISSECKLGRDRGRTEPVRCRTHRGPTRTCSRPPARRGPTAEHTQPWRRPTRPVVDGHPERRFTAPSRRRTPARRRSSTPGPATEIMAVSEAPADSAGGFSPYRADRRRRISLRHN